MEVKKISEKNNVLKLLISGADITTINSLRRTIMSEVETLAVEDVSIYENSSILPDEMLAHRLAMLPIKTDPKKYGEGEKLKLVLEKEGPGMVYSRDIKSTDPKFEIIDKKVEIIKLKKGQKIKTEMDAIMGKGKNHVKWQPAIVSHKTIADITIGKDCSLCKDCIDACSKKLLETKGKNIVLKDPIECDLCGECKDSCKTGQLKIKDTEKELLFRIETSKAMENSEIIDTAINKIEEKTEEFRKALKDL